MAQSVKRPTSTQVIISQFVGLSSVLGSVLTAQSLEPALDSASPYLSAFPLFAFSLSLSKKVNIKKLKKIFKKFLFKFQLVNIKYISFRCTI